MKIKRETYSKSRPVIKPDDLEGATHAVFTVTSVEEVTFDEQPKLVMQFEDFPDHSYFPNVTSIDALIERLGNETDKWEGKHVPLMVVQTTNPTTHKPTQALWVVPANEWDKHLGRKSSAPSRPAARKGAAKARRR